MIWLGAELDAPHVGIPGNILKRLKTDGLGDRHRAGRHPEIRVDEGQSCRTGGRDQAVSAVGQPVGVHAEDGKPGGVAAGAEGVDLVVGVIEGEDPAVLRIERHAAGAGHSGGPRPDRRGRAGGAVEREQAVDRIRRRGFAQAVNHIVGPVVGQAPHQDVPAGTDARRLAGRRVDGVERIVVPIDAVHAPVAGDDETVQGRIVRGPDPGDLTGGRVDLDQLPGNRTESRRTRRRPRRETSAGSPEGAPRAPRSHPASVP